MVRFQSTPPARGATVVDADKSERVGVSIHTPREGGDTWLSMMGVSCAKFQSTPPARGATVAALIRHITTGVSIHTPREGGDPVPSQPSRTISIVSIHTPREGGDYSHLSTYWSALSFNPHPPRGGRHKHGRFSCANVKFQSTPPARGATCTTVTPFTSSTVSIHTPREGGDSRNNRKNSGNFCDVYNTISFLHKSA